MINNLDGVKVGKYLLRTRSGAEYVYDAKAVTVIRTGGKEGKVWNGKRQTGVQFPRPPAVDERFVFVSDQTPKGWITTTVEEIVRLDIIA